MAAFKVGDKVRTKGTRPGMPEYDVGIIAHISYARGTAFVSWQRAKTGYTEELSTLEHMPT